MWRESDLEIVQAKTSGYRQFLTLRVGREMIAVPLDRIHRLQASVQLTPLPDRDTGFDGMADVGDAVVPVIDLRRMLPREAEPTGTEQAPPCLLAMIDGSVAGLIVIRSCALKPLPRTSLCPRRTPLACRYRRSCA